MSISRSESMPLVALLPFGYSWATRLRSFRAIAYLIASSWLPVIWIGWRGGVEPLPRTIALFGIGYLAFISLYELGYFANDAWDARRDEDGRGRGSRAGGAAWATLFVATRVGTWLGISWLTGWIGHPIWIVGFAALAAVFTAHNLLRLQGWPDVWTGIVRRIFRN